MKLSTLTQGVGEEMRDPRPGHSQWWLGLSATDEHECILPSEERLRELFAEQFPSAELAVSRRHGKCVIVEIPTGTKAGKRKLFIEAVERETT